MIFQNSIWEPVAVSEETIIKYSTIFQTEPLITKMLLDRGLKTREEAIRFFSPSLDALHDPFLLTDMDQAVTRIRKAVAGKEQIWLYGDYDVDGITSISILIHYFRSLGIKVQYYIPDRQDEGYGISVTGLDSIKAAGGTLVITVDCGITAVSEAEYAREIGLDLVITDHHECQETLPSAIAVVNPKREGYPFKMLAGCGVAFKLVQALAGDDFEVFYPKVIDILALGTIADIVPLADENRIFAKLGLAQMERSENAGIKALIKEANLEKKEVNAGHIGFVIAPRINASGRIGNPKIAVELLTTPHFGKAIKIAKELSALNAERQAREREIVEDAETYILKNIDLDRERVLIVVGRNWHTGIIGIVASKLSEKYSRPTVILNLEDDLAKGSARSIEGISIFEVLSQFKHLFLKFGGHEQAAGLTLKAEDVPKLKTELMAYGATSMPNYLLKLKKTVNGELTPKMVTHKLLDEIDQLKPFGVGNPRPQFAFKNLIIDDFTRIGKQQNHLKLIVNDGIRIYDALAFNQGDLTAYFRKNDRVHMLLYLEKNSFMGVETIQFMIRDMVKNRMPLSAYLLQKISEAEAAYLTSEKNIAINGKFTKIQDFDIIFSSGQALPLLIYNQEGLIRFKDYVFSENRYNYTVHFNMLNALEQREGYVDVVFMPLSEATSALMTGYVLEDALRAQTLAALIPDRDDVALIYKRIGSIEEIAVEKLAAHVNMHLTKCLLGLKLLEEMALFNVERQGALMKFHKMPRPEQKVDIEQIPLYRHLMDEWRDLSRY
ncbi:single-stranded-DNA-specific exonuclease RecJ [Fusibacter paucivorans]|uniref:Single-stranded-DNA-specific exonuclease RecJ n=1 Tax=Fusibacter paucivorans TaxID=76009 RepID=A0ABS5PUM3_9FIRM|nr:single-stranded-DNA-specific exonuclease RecJ [Fusibacter paucivorans]MBS7527732.1 single-stranded-DNA-specific exonuclease RecJ [Fusibacter paucivorans]